MTPRTFTDRANPWVAGLASLGFLAWLHSLTYRPPVFIIWGIGAAVVMWTSLAYARRWRPRTTWTTFLRDTWDVHLLVLGLLYWLAVQQVSTFGITSDGCLYFAHLRSLIFDGDLAIDPELAVLQLDERPHHIVAFGPAVVWAPLYLAVSAIDWLGQTAGVWGPPADVLSRTLTGPYARAAMIGTFLTASAGLLLLHGRLRKEFGRETALVASLLLFGATSLVYYVVYEPAMTHGASFGLVAAAVLASERWVRRGPASRSQALGLGLMFGLAFLVRPQNGLFGIFPLAFAVARVWPRGDWRQDARSLAWLVVAFAPFVLGQWLFYRALLAGAPYTLVGDEGYLRFLTPRLLDVLFSSWHGLFAWTPIVYVAALGSIWYLWRDRIWALPALLVFVLMWWVNASAEDWAGGVAFGGRRFTSTLVALAPGLALAVSAIQRRPVLLVGALAAGAIQWNAYLMTQYNDALVPKTSVVSFTDVIRRQVDMFIESPFTYPFSFPANALFAWRTGLPPDRYDLLGPEPLARVFALRLDDDGSKFLLEGWGPPDRGAGGEVFRLTSSRGASVAVPLSWDGSGVIRMAIGARSVSPGVPIDRLVVEVLVNGQPAGTATFGPDPATIRLEYSDTGGRRVWRHGYNRLDMSLTQTMSAAGASDGGGVVRRPMEIGAQLAVSSLTVEVASE